MDAESNNEVSIDKLRPVLSMNPNQSDLGEAEVARRRSRRVLVLFSAILTGAVASLSALPSSDDDNSAQNSGLDLADQDGKPSSEQLPAGTNNRMEAATASAELPTNANVGLTRARVESQKSTTDLETLAGTSETPSVVAEAPATESSVTPTSASPAAAPVRESQTRSKPSTLLPPRQSADVSPSQPVSFQGGTAAAPTPTTPTGYGTKNTPQPVMVSMVDHPVCADGAAADFNGDGWGIENGRTCIVMTAAPTANVATSSANNRQIPTLAEPVASPARPVATPIPLSAKTDQAYPMCQSSTSDPEGDGYGWENDWTCVVDVTTPKSASSAVASSNGTRSVVAPATASTGTEMASAPYTPEPPVVASKRTPVAPTPVASTPVVAAPKAPYSGPPSSAPLYPVVAKASTPTPTPVVAPEPTPMADALPTPAPTPVVAKAPSTSSSASPTRVRTAAATATAAPTPIPQCVNGAVSDADGDGIGMENGGLCEAPRKTTIAETPAVELAVAPIVTPAPQSQQPTIIDASYQPPAANSNDTTSASTSTSTTTSASTTTPSEPVVRPAVQPRDDAPVEPVAAAENPTETDVAQPETVVPPAATDQENTTAASATPPAASSTNSNTNASNDVARTVEDQPASEPAATQAPQAEAEVPAPVTQEIGETTTVVTLPDEPAESITGVKIRGDENEPEPITPNETNQETNKPSASEQQPTKPESTPEAAGQSTTPVVQAASAPPLTIFDTERPSTSRAPVPIVETTTILTDSKGGATNLTGGQRDVPEGSKEGTRVPAGAGSVDVELNAATLKEVAGVSPVEITTTIVTDGNGSGVTFSGIHQDAPPSDEHGQHGGGGATIYVTAEGYLIDGTGARVSTNGHRVTFEGGSIFYTTGGFFINEAGERVSVDGVPETTPETRPTDSVEDVEAQIEAGRQLAAENPLGALPYVPNLSLSSLSEEVLENFTDKAEAEAARENPAAAGFSEATIFVDDTWLTSVQGEPVVDDAATSQAGDPITEAIDSESWVDVKGELAAEDVKTNGDDVAAAEAVKAAAAAAAQALIDAEATADAEAEAEATADAEAPVEEVEAPVEEVVAPVEEVVAPVEEVVVTTGKVLYNNDWDVVDENNNILVPNADINFDTEGNVVDDNGNIVVHKNGKLAKPPKPAHVEAVPESTPINDDEDYLAQPADDAESAESTSDTETDEGTADPAEETAPVEADAPTEAEVTVVVEADPSSGEDDGSGVIEEPVTIAAELPPLDGDSGSVDLVAPRIEDELPSLDETLELNEGFEEAAATVAVSDDLLANINNSLKDSFSVGGGEA